MKIMIPDPCTANWDMMTAQEAGRFCTSCATTVVDFTRMTDEEVQNYLLANAHQKMCGRFRESQLAPVPAGLQEVMSHTSLPYWKKFLAIVIVVFGSLLTACNETPATTTGVMVPADTVNVTAGLVVPMDTTVPGQIPVTPTKDKLPVVNPVPAPDPQIMGGIRLIDPPPPGGCRPAADTTLPTEQMIMGDVVMPEPR
ncbi:hypothetical protein [Chitinophaga nivalis]|uniref:DUF1289 domain-containing protein n=1 Tax=Chitinophaga nivalis TaxID=2991709 RepID=A0ABT3IWE6_9BACT|nr:hypothetical protein [Chitinophaga nivalis]MCW3462015.1 hypothetical protein [Chitinophaga nivalis]MCW3488293.1 hypothetical protein [Chitinophaga nivalis]